MDHRIFRCTPCKRQGNVLTWPINPVFGRYCTWCKGQANIVEEGLPIRPRAHLLGVHEKL